MDKKVEEKTRIKKTKRKYPLPRADMSLEKEIDVLKGLVQFSNKGDQPVKYDEIKIPKIHPTRVSAELKFLASIGLAERKAKGIYVPTSKAIEFVNTLNWKKEEDATQIIKEVISKSWFGDLVIKMLNITKEASLGNIISELGKTVEGDPKKDVKAIKRLVEWLKYAEIIEIDENEIVHLKEVSTSQNVEEKSPPAEKIESVSKTIMEEEMVKSEGLEKVQKGILLNLTINLQIDSNTDIERIREIIRVIKKYLVEDNDV